MCCALGNKDTNLEHVYKVDTLQNHLFNRPIMVAAN